MLRLLQPPFLLSLSLLVPHYHLFEEVVVFGEDTWFQVSLALFVLLCHANQVLLALQVQDLVAERVRVLMSLGRLVPARGCCVVAEAFGKLLLEWRLSRGPALWENIAESGFFIGFWESLIEQRGVEFWVFALVTGKRFQERRHWIIWSVFEVGSRPCAIISSLHATCHYSWRSLYPRIMHVRFHHLLKCLWLFQLCL